MKEEYQYMSKLLSKSKIKLEQAKNKPNVSQEEIHNLEKRVQIESNICNILQEL